MNTKLAYPCTKCSHSEVIDFLNPPEFCSNCGAPIPPLQIPVETNLPTPEVKKEEVVYETEAAEDPA
jgi:hypothetical protein